MIKIHLGKQLPNPPVGSSHWFGYPDMLPGEEVPTVDEGDDEYALNLIAQINLADLPANSDLPPDGLLLFFADIAYYCGDWDEPAISMYPSDNRVCRVLYVPADLMGELRNVKDFYEAPLDPEAIAVTFSDKSSGKFYEPDLQLLGTSSHLEWDTWPEPCEGWRLLLQMDSMEGPDYNYNFVDFGVLCFIIAPDALAARDFSDVRAIILST